jgi:hypothetical protein
MENIAQINKWEYGRDGKIVEVQMKTLADLRLVTDGRIVCQQGNKYFFIDSNGIMYSFQ